MKGITNSALIVVLAIIVATGQALAIEKVKADKADVRILIDVSGSMKKNDPKNLRRPALRLLVGLLSSDTRAGVWTFGQYVNMQIPLGQVDRAWKRKARHSSKSIGSPGQFTNIEAALKRSTEDWRGPPGPYRRSVILLTDGMVDISKDKQKNAASKQRILKKILPRLKVHQVTVHTIALSKNADHELMQQLADQTGGWYEQTESAEALQKVFLRIFEKVGKPDSVPLKDNKFSIDPSITEATLLVFHKPDAKPTEVVPPEGQPFNADSAPSSVSWHRDEGYDMLTVSDPKAGEWRIRAEVDPDNRVMVVTDLKMVTTELPNRIIHGLSFPYQVSFTDHGKTIKKQEFLHMVNVASSCKDILGVSEPRPITDDGRIPDLEADDGYFTMAFGGESLQSGMGELIINAKGATFNRERRTTFQVVPPVELNLTPRDDGRTLDLQLRADDKLIDTDSLQIEAWLEGESGSEEPLSLVRSGANGAIASVIDLMSFSGPRKVMLKAQAKSLDGEIINYIDGPVEVEGMKSVAPEPTPTPTPLPAEPEPEPQVEPTEPVEDEQERPGWERAVIWFGVINLVLIILGGGLFWWVRRSKLGNEISLVDEASTTEGVEVGKEKSE
jgi:uncharacterized protein (TIGR03503 family)